jgi:multidrug resistance efflux pump
MKARIPALMLALSLAASISAGCGSSTRQVQPTPLPVVTDLTGKTAEGRLEPIRFVTLAPAADALVSEVLVTEGEQVQEGQLLVRFDNANAQTLEAARTRAALELSDAYEAVRVAQNELDAYPLPRVFAGLTAEEAARTWLTELDAARKAFEPYKDTSRKGYRRGNTFPRSVYPSFPQRVLLDTKDYDEVAMVFKKRVDVGWMNYTKAVLWLKLDSALASSKARLADAQRRYDSLQDGGITDLTAGSRAALATAEIRAPFDGTVTNVDLKLGEVATAGEAAVTLADTSSWIIKTTDLTEIDVVGIQDGVPVSVALDAMPGQVFRGSVTSVALDYSERQGDVVYPVSVLLQDTTPGMRWGMTAEVTFKE